MDAKGQLLTFLLLIFNLSDKVITGENILVVMPMFSSSHLRPFIPLVEELIKKGHNLTVISKYPMAADDLQTKYHHVEVKTNYESKKTDVTTETLLRMNRFRNFLYFFEYYYYFSEEVLSLPALQRLRHSQDHYDLVIAELFYMDVFFAFGYHFKAPIVAVCSTNLMYFYSWILGNPYPSSYIPNQLLWYTENMSLSSRISNTVFNLFSVLYYELVSLPNTQIQMKRFFSFEKNDVPNVKDIMRNISLVLVNSHYSFGYIKPELPNIVNIAGLHSSASKPFPQRIKSFMEGASNGVIYLSLGSFTEPADFVELGNTFIRELRNFPQRVIMKWNPKLLTEIPDNILVEEWVSQIEVLNHPKCRLFITHGGINSVFESINVSVPILGIPLLSDQHYNMAAAEHLGIGRMVPLDEVSVRLSSEVKEVLNNLKYKENIVKRSQLFRERLASPLDEAMYWVEHVMKHKTTTHLKSAAVQLTWYEFYAVDVLVILLAMILSTLLMLKLLAVWILKYLSAKIKKMFSSMR